VLGAWTADARAAAALHLADRYGEVFAASRTAEGDALPSIDEILRWVRFIQLQCPE